MGDSVSRTRIQRGVTDVRFRFVSCQLVKPGVYTHRRVFRIRAPTETSPRRRLRHGECGHYTGLVGGTTPEWIPANTHQQHERDESRYQENREDQEQTPHQIKLAHSPNVGRVDIMRQGIQTKARTVVNRR